MRHASVLFSLSLWASFISAAAPMPASAESPIGYGDSAGMFIGTMDGADVFKMDGPIILNAQRPEQNTLIGMLPDSEQVNCLATVQSDSVQFASDGIGLLLRFRYEGGDAATLTGLINGPRAPDRPAIAFVRPFVKAGCKLPVDAHPGIMDLGGAGLQHVTFDVTDALPGLFTACLVDESGRKLDLVGTTSAEGRFLATGVGDEVTVRITGKMTTDASGRPTAIEANIAIEDRFGKPVANGIIAILIGL